MNEKRNNSSKVDVHAQPGPMKVSEEAMTPLVDIYTSADGATNLQVEVPGATAESVDVRVDKGVLTISAGAPLRGSDEKYAKTYVGFTGGQYFRAFALSDEVDRDKIEASLADGVLSVKLPRAAAAQTRKIEVKGE